MNYTETTVHDVQEIVIEQHEGRPGTNTAYHVMNIGVRGEEGKIYHLSLFSRKGRITITKLGDIDAKE